MNSYKKMISYMIASLVLCMAMFLPSTQAQVAFAEHYEMTEGLNSSYYSMVVPGCDSVSGFKVLTTQQNSIKVGWIHPVTKHQVKYKLSWTDGITTKQQEFIANANDAKAMNYVIPFLKTNVDYNISIVASCNISAAPNLNDTWVDGEITTITAMPMSDICDAPCINIIPSYNNFNLNLGCNLGTSPYATDIYMRIFSFSQNKVIYEGIYSSFTASLESCQKYQVDVWQKCLLNGATPTSNTTTSTFETLCCGEIKDLKVVNTESDDFELSWELTNPQSTLVQGFQVDISQGTSPATFAGYIYTNSATMPEKYKFLYSESNPNTPLVESTDYNISITPICGNVTGIVPNIKVTTADACKPPTDLTVSSITQTQATVRWTQQNSIKLRSYKVSLLNDVNVVLQTKWVSSGVMTNLPMEQAFDNLQPNKGYKVLLHTMCCEDYAAGCYSNPLDQAASGWNQQVKVLEFAFTTEKEPCATTSIVVTQPSPTTIKIDWNEPAGAIQQYAANLLSDGKIIATQQVIGKGIAANPLSLTFTDLTPNTKYVVTFLPSCCLAQVSGSNVCAQWAAAESISKKVTTPAEPGNNCNTTFLVKAGHDNIVLTWQSTNTTPLSTNGRRFIVNMKSSNTSMVILPVSSPVIDKDIPNNSVKINGLIPNEDYTIEVTEAFDMGIDNRNFTQACPMKSIDFKTKDKSELCDLSLSITPYCATSHSLIFKINKLAGTGDIKLRAIYREMSGYYKANTSNFNYYCITNPQDVTTTIAVNPTIKWKTLPQLDYTESKVGTDFILPNLMACSAYEVIFEQIQTINGVEEICQTHQFQTCLGTTDATVNFTDNDKDGIPTGCDDDEKIETPSTTTANALPDVSCGEPLPTTNASQTLITPTVGQVININKIPLEITKITTSANNVITGEGILGLPFQNNKLLVNLNAIKVNDKYDVVDGTVTGMRTDKTQISTIIKNVNEFNEKQQATFCNKPIEEGFVNGVNTATGTAINQYGFNSNGDYGKIPIYPGYVNGSPFDPNFSPDGKDKDGKQVHTCPTGVPYCWLKQDPAETIAGGVLYAKVKVNLRADILKILNSAKDEATKKKALFEPKCNLLRLDMKGLLAGSLIKQEKTLVLGPKEAWINQGMSRHFGKVPLPFSVNMNRVADQKIFEQKHIDLFSCDVELTEAVDLLEVIKELSTDPVLKTLEEGIAYKLKRLGDDASKKLQDPLEFTKWLNTEVEVVIKQHLAGKKQQIIKITAAFDEDASTGLASVEKAKVKTPFTFAADNDKLVLNLLRQQEQQPEQALDDEEALLQFEYEQGFTTVGGVNRAFILEDIFQKRQIRKALGMEDVTGATGTGLPIGLVKPVAGKEQAVYFDNITFTPDAAKTDVFVIVSTDKKQIVFQALNVKFSRSGLIGDVSLGLASDVSFPVNNTARIILKGEGNTYVKIDCDGFKSLKIKAEIEFCRNYLIPLDPTTLNELGESEKVKASFETLEIQSFNDIVISNLTITDFALADYKETKFKLGNAVLDFSDTQTPTAVKFPEGYFSAHTDPSTTTAGAPTVIPREQWKGFYIARFNVTLPKKLTSKIVDAAQPPVSVAAEDLIIDDGGVTGKIKVTANILPIENGKLGGWAFSIDNFSLGVVKNKVNEGGFGGKIHVPITKKDAQNYFTYKAAILPFNQYQFVLSPLSDIDVSLWKAKAKFLSNSKIMVEYKKVKPADTENQFVATAELYGDLTIGDGTSSFAEMDGVHFEKLTLCNHKSPKYFQGGKWSMPKVGAKMKGFEIEVSGIQVRSGTTAATEKDIYLDFTINVLLGGEKKTATATNPAPANDDQKFKLAAGGSFTLIGKVEEEQEIQKYVYSSIAINKISIDGTVPGATVKGAIEFFPKPGQTVDPTFGEGFFGGVWIDIEGLAGMGAVATFGKKTNTTSNKLYKYFIIDVLADFHEGIPMGPVNLTAAGGGVYWHMNKVQTNGVSSELPMNLVPKDVSIMTAGSTFTGDNYTPDDTKSIGIRLLAGIANAANKKAFNLNVAFEMAFGADYGIERVELRGVAQFMKEPNKQGSQDTTKAISSDFTGIVASINMIYDVPKKTFQANLSMRMNITGGTVQGCHSGYRVGSAEVYLAPKVWYVNIGRTDAARKEFISIGIGLPGAAPKPGNVPCAGKFKFDAYFSVGNSIPPMAPLPDWAQQLANQGLNSTDQSIRANGRGFAFGARTSFSFDKEYKKGNWGVYAAANIDLGFDMMLMDYGSMTCGAGGPKVGMNGWYASGQAFARVEGAVGVVYKSKRHPILSAGLALVLQAKGPNPFWAKGNAKVQYSILGIFKGSKTMKFEVGERCIMSNDPADPNGDSADAIIAAVTPESNTLNVSLRARPIVEFNVPMDKTSELSEDDPNDDKKSIDSKITSTIAAKKVVLKGSNTEISGHWKMNSSNTAMTFYADRMLPANQELNVAVKVNTKQVFTNVKNKSDINTSEEKTVTFKTEGAMVYIPEDNISGSYPMNGMYNYYRKELNSDAGYIQLIYPQDDIFTNIPDGYFLGARLYCEGKKTAQFNCTYAASTARITYNIPNEKLEKGKVYKMSIGLLPSYCDDEAKPAAATSGGSSQLANVSSGAEEGGPCPKSKIAYTMYFRVSNYEKFYDKINPATLQVQVVDPIKHLYNIKINGITEPFDNFEMGKVSGRFPLVVIDDKTLDGTDFINTVQANLYEKFLPTWVNDFKIGFTSNNSANTIEKGKINISTDGVAEVPYIDVSFYEGKTASVSASLLIVPYTKFNAVLKDYDEVRTGLDDAKNQYEGLASNDCGNPTVCLNAYNTTHKPYADAVETFPALPSVFKLSFKYKPLSKNQPTGDAANDNYNLDREMSSTIVEKQINR